MKVSQGLSGARRVGLSAAAMLSATLWLSSCASGGATSSGMGKFDDAAVAQGDLLDLQGRAALAISVDTAATLSYVVFNSEDGQELALVGLDPGLHHRVIVVPPGRYCINQMKMAAVSLHWPPERGCFDAVADEVTYFGRLTIDEQRKVGLDRSRLKEDFVTFQGRHPDFPAL